MAAPPYTVAGVLGPASQEIVTSPLARTTTVLPPPVLVGSPAHGEDDLDWLDEDDFTALEDDSATELP